MNENGNNEWIVICPHCNEFVIINELNCCIFRHGIIKDTGEQMNPHASKQECDNLKKNDLIFGCGKPFKITFNGENAIVEICDYI
jgi:hypothetical protein